jgi:hypothetical protein
MNGKSQVPMKISAGLNWHPGLNTKYSLLNTIFR